MSALTETYTLSLAPDLALTSSAVDQLLAWANLQGYSIETTKAWRLPLMEGLVNAIRHGCAGRPSAQITASARCHDEGIDYTIQDPGHFVPGPLWTQLPDDPLSEAGRGGFLIAQGTDAWRHDNDAQGHRLVLTWKKTPPHNLGVITAAQATPILESLTGELANSYEIIAGYAHFAGLLATAQNFTELLLGVRQQLSSVIPHAHFLLRLIEQDSLQLADGPDCVSFPASLSLQNDTLESRVAIQGHVLTVKEAWQIARNDPLASAASPLAILPVTFANKILGTLTVTTANGASLFTAGQIDLLNTVADFLGIAHATDQFNRNRERQLRLQQDIAIAAGIQRLLLPQSMPKVPGWRICGECRPAREIGGDYFDFIVRSDQTCLVVIADVMGKGIPAALVATMFRTALRAQASESASPGEILTLLNEQLAPDLAALDVFITVLLMVLPVTGTALQYANAGHCPPLLVDTTSGATTQLAGGDMPLGILANTTIQDHQADMPAASALFAYTDGCFEWRQTNGSMLGSIRFINTLTEHIRRTTPDLVTQVLNDITTMASGNGLPDDCTLVAIQRNNA